jgi:hypothetical protein
MEQWQTWLREMTKQTTWGDHISLQAMSNHLAVQIRVLSSSGDPLLLEPFHEPIDPPVITLGHVQETHYVSLVPKGNVFSHWYSHVTVLYYRANEFY